jgi:hypothetical protein
MPTRPMSAGPARISGVVVAIIAAAGLAAASMWGPPRSMPEAAPGEDASSHFQRGVLLWQRGDLDAALRSFERAVRAKQREAELKVEEL